MMRGKCFGILIEREGEGGAQGAPIADIADIAGIARDRKNQSLPRIDADERGSGMGLEG
jgi:hypothetical protein